MLNRKFDADNKDAESQKIIEYELMGKLRKIKNYMNMIQKINTENDLRALLTEVISYLGWAFHPDNPMTDYVRRDTGERSYTLEESKRLDSLMDEAFSFCKQHDIDIYELSMEISKELYGDIFAEKEVA